MPVLKCYQLCLQIFQVHRRAGAGHAARLVGHHGHYIAEAELHHGAGRTVDYVRLPVRYAVDAHRTIHYGYAECSPSRSNRCVTHHLFHNDRHDCRLPDIPLQEAAEGVAGVQRDHVVCVDAGADADHLRRVERRPVADGDRLLRQSQSHR